MVSELGNRIKQIRVERRETLEEFAESIVKISDESIKTTKSNVSKWEKGLHVPNDISLSCIAKLGNTDVSELLNNNLGQRIKQIRQELGENLQTFGERFDPPANRSLVSAWENGRYTPNNSRLKVIAELGNTTVRKLLNENNAQLSYEDISSLEELQQVALGYANPYIDPEINEFAHRVYLTITEILDNKTLQLQSKEEEK